MPEAKLSQAIWDSTIQSNNLSRQCRDLIEE